MKKIFYIGNFSFPYGNASGARVLGNGFLLNKIGYDVSYIGLNDELKRDSLIESTKQEYKNFTYYNLPYPKGFKDWLAYRNRFEEVISVLEKEKPYGIILYGSPTLSFFGKLILNWSKKNNVLCFTDCVDWLASGSGSLMHRLVKSFDNNYQKRFLNASTDGVITISSYLSNYYKNKKCKTVVIPPLVDPKKFEKIKKKTLLSKNDKLKLIYVGQPFATDGRKVKEKSFKDRLDKAIDILASLENSNFIFDIYGIMKDEYLKVIPNQSLAINKLGEKIKFHGRIENSLAVEKVAESDFTILFRDVSKMTSAGFPTKFVESISCGTPVITTNTSDLGKYVKGKENGFFIDINDKGLSVKQVEEIFSLEREDIEKMKSECFNSQLFYYQNFVPEMKTFLSLFNKK